MESVTTEVSEFEAARWTTAQLRALHEADAGLVGRGVRGWEVSGQRTTGGDTRSLNALRKAGLIEIRGMEPQEEGETTRAEVTDLGRAVLNADAARAANRTEIASSGA